VGALILDGKTFGYRARSLGVSAAGQSRMVIGALEKGRLALVLEQAQRAGITGSIADVLRDPRTVNLVGSHFQVPQPSLDACRRHYHENVEAFRQPERYLGRQIVLRCSTGDPAFRAECIARAERLIAILFFDPRMFGDLLASYDSQQDQPRSGRIGPVARGVLAPELEAALFQLRPGQISPTPVITATGVHVVLLDRIFPGDVAPFEAVHDAIAATLRSQYRRAAAERHLARLAARCRDIGRDG
jgi:hypothetical protein